MDIYKRMKYNLLLLISFFTIFCSAQQNTIKIKTDIYVSTFDTLIHQPLYVEYKLYHGGGSCSRESLYFKESKYSAKSSDYSKSGYDKGHLANAEDFAYDCLLDKQTFQYYNCLPQTPNLNRGIWKEIETKIRDISQTDSLLIICGGLNYKKINKLYVPSKCWKIVQSLSTSKILFCGIFENDEDANLIEISIENLEQNIGYKINFKKWKI